MTAPASGSVAVELLSTSRARNGCAGCKLRTVQQAAPPALLGKAWTPNALLAARWRCSCLSPTQWNCKDRPCLQTTPAAELAAGTVLHRVEGTYVQFAAFKAYHHRLELQEASFQREEASPVLPLTPRTHVLIENSCLQGEAGCELCNTCDAPCLYSVWH